MNKVVGLIAKLSVSMLTVLSSGTAYATTPGRETGELPAAFREKARALPAGSAPFHVKRGLQRVAQRAQFARFKAKNQLSSQPFLSMPQVSALTEEFPSDVAAELSQKVRGTRQIPVVTVIFSEFANPPYSESELQKELFDGPWPTGTMTEYYKEISSGNLTLRGRVTPWAKLSNTSEYYEGTDFVNPDTGLLEPCFGVCTNSKVHELISEALSSPVNSGTDWGQYDNEGPDNIPNSGDDDGFVDFVAFVHPEIGGECQESNKNIWSHSWDLGSSPAGAFETKSPRHGGGFIKVDDFTIQPGLDCSGQKMIQIGVFAHEFGHAFGLPDLYDTDRRNGASAGIGTWCLMSAGSWGGDRKTPERPTHMSPWAKSYLGWLEEKSVLQDEANAKLVNVQSSAVARKVRISPTQYYLVANVQQTGFNDKLPGAGLQIWKINQSVISSTMGTNRVNADANNRGVELVEADGNHGLNDPQLFGEPGDVFPGATGKRRFDVASNPASIGQVAVCSIPASAEEMRVRLLISRNRCPGSPLPANAAGGGPSDVPAVVGQTVSPQGAVSVDSIKAMPIGSRVLTQGVLRNLGTSYFEARKRRIALVAADGTSVDVAVNSATEVAASPDGRAPEALPSLLDKVVLVEGVVERVEGEQGDQTRIRAQSVKIVPPSPE